MPLGASAVCTPTFFSLVYISLQYFQNPNGAEWTGGRRTCEDRNYLMDLLHECIFVLSGMSAVEGPSSFPNPNFVY